MCGHCNQEYQRNGDHEANCLELIKFKNLELSAKLEESNVEVANVRSDLESAISELENVKRTTAQLKAKEAELLETRQSTFSILRFFFFVLLSSQLTKPDEGIKSETC